MDELIASVSGLRGMVGTSLTVEVAVRYAAAFATTLPAGPVVVGRDGRTSGGMFADAITAMLQASGRDVIDCGIAATPTVGIVVDELHAVGGMQISASHNPPEYNGLKLFSSSGRVITATAGRSVLERFERGDAPERSAATGIRRSFDGGPLHLSRVLAAVDVAAIRRLGPRVWLDAGHGAGSRVAGLLFAALGCEAVIEGGTPDGRFEHTPEPTEENLAAMLPRIAAAGVDVGFFQDPDADRLAVATATGRYVGEEATLPLAVEAVLARTRGSVVVNCSTSSMTSIVADRFGVPCHVSAVGEANVVERMVAERAIIGGEGNGGVIDPRVVLVRDSIVAMALVLERMCASGGRIETVESLVARLPRRVMRKTKIELAPALRGPGIVAALDRLEAAFPEMKASRLDGLRLDDERTWLLVRASNTEPIVRVVAEAESADRADDVLAKARAAMEADTA